MERELLQCGLSESVGLINRKRNQKDGYSIAADYGAGIGFDNNSPFYQSVNFSAVYYKLLNPIVELSAGFSTGYTTSTSPSLIHYLGPGNVNRRRIGARILFRKYSRRFHLL